jgi:hypothetical protein
MLKVGIAEVDITPAPGLPRAGMPNPKKGEGVGWPLMGRLFVFDDGARADFADSHTYWNFPLWESPPGTQTAPMVGATHNAFSTLSLNRRFDKPFFVSEWDHAWPDEWRAESPLAYAAIAAFQGWSGVTIHTYRYSTWKPADRLGGGASTINGITYRNHFDSFNDPAKFGLFYHAGLLLRRGDVRPAEKTAAVQVADDGGAWLTKRAQDFPALALLPEVHRVGMVLPGEPCKADVMVPGEQPSVDKGPGEVLSDTGELWRSWQKRYGWIDTPRTKAAYGFLAAAGPIILKGLELEVKNDFATIALSSLTDDPIEQSDSLLLTAVGRCDNTDAKYDADHRLQLDFGHLPVLIEAIEAKIKLTTKRSNLKVIVISEHGEFVTKLPTEYKDGVLTFSIGPQPSWNPSTMYYLIRI